MYWRVYRNLENSLLEHLRTNFDKDWSNVNIELSFKKVIKSSLPVIHCQWDSSTMRRLEIGNNLMDENHLITIDIYATSNAQRLDLAAYLIDLLRHEFPYYEYAPNSTNKDKTFKCKKGWVFLEVTENTKVDFGENADVFDRYRHRIELRVIVNITEG